jgi:hypothetical protein
MILKWIMQIKLINNYRLMKTECCKLNFFIVLVLLFFALPCIYSFHTGAQLLNQNQATCPKPEPTNWFAGDIHVHRSCNGGPAIPVSELRTRMEVNDLAVISVLSDMGNSEAQDRVEDLQKVNGNDAPQSGPGRIIHFAAEWHWDANQWESPHQALGGHLVLLGLTEAHKIWDESPYKILDWAKKHDALSGFAHMQYLNDHIQNKLNCCIPIDYPVEAALGTIDFVSEDVNGGDPAVHAYYKLLNCGFRLGLAAGTDYPCNGGAPFGTLLTYVQINDGKLTYQKWIEGIKKGNTVVSRNGHNEFLEMKINGKYEPGDEIDIKNKGTVTIEVKWTAVKELTGRIELVSNGKVVATQIGTTKPGEPLILKTTQEFTKSSWICARRMDEKGHQSHTAPIYITVKNKPVRASAEDAEYFVKWIDNILEKIAPGGAWSRYYTQNLEDVMKRYRQSREIYSGIALDAQKINNK